MMAVLKHSPVCLGLLACGGLAATGVAQAQPTGAYPVKSIRIIVPFPPGGGTDKLARMLASRFTTTLGQPVVVDNRGGAGGVVGTEMVAKSPPDGHTLLFVTSAFAMGAGLRDKLPYDPIRDFAPVTIAAVSPSLLIVHPSLPVNTVKELLAFARANPGRLNYGSTGAGAPYHIATEMLKSMGGVDIAHVPYKGAGPAIVAALSGEVTMLIGNIISALPLARSGRMRALGVTTPKRTPLAPEIPTIHEAGLPGYEFVTWFGLLAPGATPAAVVQRLHGEVQQAIKTPEFRAALLADGAEPNGIPPEQYAAVIKADIQRYSQLAKKMGLTAE
jgi:tripartite-type tricarboxylate transporter receptor subunit TctC